MRFAFTTVFRVLRNARLVYLDITAQGLINDRNWVSLYCKQFFFDHI